MCEAMRLASPVSRHNHITAITEISGSEATRAPNAGLRFATSDTMAAINLESAALEQVLELARLRSQAMTTLGLQPGAPDVVAHEKNRPRAQVERFESSDEATSSELFCVL